NQVTNWADWAAPRGIPSGLNPSNARASSSAYFPADQPEIALPTALSTVAARASRSSSAEQQRLYLRPLPHGHGVLRPRAATRTPYGPARPCSGCRPPAAIACSAVPAVSVTDVESRLEETIREVERLRAENERLRTLLSLSRHTRAVTAGSAARTVHP